VNKVRDLPSAIREFIHDGDTVVMEGFTHLIPFAAGHEILRQRIGNLTLVRLTPDLIYDQMIAAGCCRKLVFSWAGNPGVGSLHAFRRAVERGALELEEYSHFGLAMRLFAGAANLPFMPLHTYEGSDLPKVNPRIRTVRSPYGDEELYAVPPITPDAAVVHAQRADEDGNVQVIVPREIVRSDPNRTLIPGVIVSAVCRVPYGAHPSYAQGYYDRDTAFYVDWDEIARDESRLARWLGEWVFETPSREAYMTRLGRERIEKLTPERRLSEPVNYGRYR
jgi:glutaconate CoA-transferase subunit A